MIHSTTVKNPCNLTPVNIMQLPATLLDADASFRDLSVDSSGAMIHPLQLQLGGKW